MEPALKPGGNRRMQDRRFVHEAKSLWHMEKQNSAPGREAKGSGVQRGKKRMMKGMTLCRCPQGDKQSGEIDFSRKNRR